MKKTQDTVDEMAVDLLGIAEILAQAHLNLSESTTIETCDILHVVTNMVRRIGKDLREIANTDRFWNDRKPGIPGLENTVYGKMLEEERAFHE